jgi:hypothetical protein
VLKTDVVVTTQWLATTSVKAKKFGVRRQAVSRATPLFEMMRDEAFAKPLVAWASRP